MANKYAQFFALLKELNATGLNLTKEEAVKNATAGRTESLSSLTPAEYTQLITGLQAMRTRSVITSPAFQGGVAVGRYGSLAQGNIGVLSVNTTRNPGTQTRIIPLHPAVGSTRDKMRKAIIAIFKSIGRTTDDAIKWAEKQGVDGHKRDFNDYNGQELFILIRIAEKVKADHIASVINPKTRTT